MHLGTYIFEKLRADDLCARLIEQTVDLMLHELPKPEFAEVYQIFYDSQYQCVIEAVIKSLHSEYQ